MPKLYPWQQSLWQHLALRPQHPHAYLFHGPMGIGKRQLADHLAHFLLCQQPQGQQPCGQCKACQLLAAGSHPDYLLLVPEDADKPIRVEQVRDLIGVIACTAQQGGRKVVVLEPAEAMNLSAANALLKSLEEPAGDTHLFLLSHQPSRLLATIKSRCVQQRCPMPERKQALQWLMQACPEVQLSEAEQLLDLAAGAPLAAQQLQQQGVLRWREQVRLGLEALHQGQTWPGLLAEQWSELPLIWALDWFYAWALQGLRTQMLGQALAEHPTSMGEGWITRCSAAQLLAFQAWVLEQRQQVLGRANLNRTLLLEALLVQWSSLGATG